MDFLRKFLDALLPPRLTATRISSTSISELGTFSNPSLMSVNGVDLVWLLPYRAPLVRSLILEAKYHEHATAHALLGSVLAEYLLSLLEETAFDNPRFVLVPIPLSKRRHRERGYNQTEGIVREAIKLLPDSFSLDTRLVRRVRDTTPQTRLGRKARLTNMNGAFSLVSALDSDCTYIVIDDVSTTGATLSACTDAFRTVGADKILLLALAH